MGFFGNHGGGDSLPFVVEVCEGFGGGSAVVARVVVAPSALGSVWACGGVCGGLVAVLGACGTTDGFGGVGCPVVVGGVDKAADCVDGLPGAFEVLVNLFDRLVVGVGLAVGDDVGDGVVDRVGLACAGGLAGGIAAASVVVEPAGGAF